MSTRLALLLIDDAVYLPRVVQPLLEDPRIDLRGAILIPQTRARSAHPGGRLGWRAVLARARLYGLRGFAGLVAVHLLARPRAWFARRTLRQLARAHGAEPVRWSRSVNTPELTALIAGSGADVVLGVFSERAEAALRHATRGGLILLHYSLLPRFAGREPTFWTMLQAPEAGGVTFFRADQDIDGGDVAGRGACSLGGVASLHGAITRLSEAAGAIAADAVCRGARGELEPQRTGSRSRCGWPTRSDVRAFRARGLRFA